MPGEFYAEVSYRCAAGFVFDHIERSVKGRSGEKFNKLYCSEGRWEGRIPECLEVGQGGNVEDFGSACSDQEERRLRCDHACVLITANTHESPGDDDESVSSCKCHVGYTLNEEDGRTCLGIYYLH